MASQVIARIGNPHRFVGRKQLIRLTGYDLNAKRSDSAVPVISKRGNGDLSPSKALRDDTNYEGGNSLMIFFTALSITAARSLGVVAEFRFVLNTPRQTIWLDFGRTKKTTMVPSS